MSQEKTCRYCNGTGSKKCSKCGGAGYYNQLSTSFIAILGVPLMQTTFCTSCGGKGKMICPYCRGTGKE